MTDAGVFDADPLRLLRAARIASELGFGIEPATAAAVAAQAQRLGEPSPERVRDELARILALPDAERALRLLDGLRLLDVILPEVAAGRGVSQPEQYHVFDVFEHNMRAVGAMDRMLARGAGDAMSDEVWEAFGWCAPQLRAYVGEELSEGRPRAALLKLAALLHDVAKPQTRTVDAGGRIRFFGHAEAGARTARGVLRRLRFSGREVRFVTSLVAEHLRPVQLAKVGQAPTRRALYRFHRDVGEALPAVLLLALADAAASRGPAMTAEGWRQHVAYMNSLLVRSFREEGILDAPRLLTGHDIMSELQIPAGPAVGALLEALREAQAAGDVATREQALRFVGRRYRRAGEGGGAKRGV
jgi:putative nucleotidyltransferase with HDIG domain